MKKSVELLHLCNFLKECVIHTHTHSQHGCMGAGILRGSKKIGEDYFVFLDIWVMQNVSFAIA